MLRYKQEQASLMRPLVRPLMRPILDGLYDCAAALAALGMICVLSMVLASVVGRQLGFNLAGSDAYAGYAMAACGFLAMAHTLKRGGHIRVTLLIGRLHGAARRTLELGVLTLAVLLAGVVAFYAVRLVTDSFHFNDISTGNDATPLWMPQLSMAIGSVILLIAFVDEWALEIAGRRKHAGENEEALHHE